MCYRSSPVFSRQVFSQKALKTALKTLLLKKSNLDASAMNNCRSMLSLLFLCSIIQNAVFIQVNAFMMQNNYFNIFQSEIGSNHNLESALIKEEGIYSRFLESETNKAGQLFLTTPLTCGTSFLTT